MFAFLNKKNLRQYIYKVNYLPIYICISYSFWYFIDNIIKEDLYVVQLWMLINPHFDLLKKIACLLQNIIHSSGSVQDEMAHYLYVLQSVTLNHLEPRMRTPLDCYSQVSYNMRSPAQRENTCCCLSFLWLPVRPTHVIFNNLGIRSFDLWFLFWTLNCSWLKCNHSPMITDLDLHQNVMSCSLAQSQFVYFSGQISNLSPH